MSASRTIWNATWRLAVCAALLAWIFHAIFTNEAREIHGATWDSLSRGERWEAAWRVGPAQLWLTIRNVSPIAFAVSLVCMGGTILLGVWRWRLVLGVQGLSLSIGRALEISLVAHFFNSFLLGSTGGDLMKAYYAARETRHKKTEAVVTVFADRLIGLWSMLLFAGLFMIINASLLLRHEAFRAVSGFVLLMLLACSGLAILAFWGGVSRRFGGARGWLRKLPKGEWLERSLDSCRQFGQAPGFLPRAMGYSMALNALCVLQFWVLSIGLGLQVPVLVLFFVVPVVICISALPITPSGLGVRENLFVLMLAVPEIQVAQTSALSLSLLAYAGSLFWSLVGGIVYLSRRERRHLDEVKAEADQSGEIG
ncbi:MAG: flippase-like domain-containing protein [Opitutaceae bacterium]|nr:flippase-like domain-containing protein [Verrucomicrobiales bacterium]